MQVPFLNLDAQYQQIKDEIQATISEVIESKNFIQGPYAESFEKNFNEVHGCKFSVGCSNGTSAITVALRSLGVGPGDEVITAANTFFATVEAIHEVGAKIVLVDCRPDTYCIDLVKMEEAIGKKTKCLIPVHLYGNLCEMDRVMEVANKYNLSVIEDSAQAHLAKYKNAAVGTFGNIGTFSFYPGKNLGAYGDAGLIVTRDEKLQQNLKMQVNHGRTKKYEHDFLAGNFRMDGLQAAILNVKLKYLSEWTQKRIDLAKKYDAALKNKGFKVIEVQKDGVCVYHLYIVEVSNREEVMNTLKATGISTGIHYPVPMHLQPALAFLGHKLGDFPNAENSCDRILSLPFCPYMVDMQLDYTVEKFLEVAKG